MENNWKQIWANRGIVDTESDDLKELFCQLKRVDGFDLDEGAVGYADYIRQCDRMLEQFPSCVKSVYEIGCGSGPVLLYLESKGYQTGGIDYSLNLIGSAKNILKSADLICGEASEVGLFPQYDAVIAVSVFQYFDGLNYAKTVLERAYKKCVYAIALLEIYESEKEDAFYEYRRAIDKEYDIRYKNLPKTFYPRCFFEEFAKEHGLILHFDKHCLEGYWNSGFVYDVYFVKA